MQRTIILLLASTLVLLPSLPALATCGGGGGGGVGGAVAGGGSGPVTYQVPWQVVATDQSMLAASEGLTLLWFPTSAEEAKASDLQTSRTLTLLSARCVHPLIVTPDNAKFRANQGVSGGATVVLADAEGKEVGRLPQPDGSLRAAAVEKLVREEVERIDAELSAQLADAKKKQSAGQDDEAAALLEGIAMQGCLAPRIAKKAAKALRKMGREVPARASASLLDSTLPDLALPDLALPDLALPDLSRRTERRITRAMTQGVIAERESRFADARAAYEKAREIDPADPVPVRFLAEFHRHQSGDWQRAAGLFNQVLAGRADAISRAVALHGLGKMTIHSGDFDQGLALFHRSIEAFPLPLTYRNLAVYWNSEGERDKAYGFVEAALALAPSDPYNQVFAATYLVERGERERALAIATANEGFLEASYNLAAIHAQLGHRDRALEFLHRHFYGYEQFDSVRAKEMQEARDDIVFASYHQDPEFVALTAMATSDASSYHQELAPSAAGMGGGER